MGQIDALIAARVSKPSGIVAGEVPVWNGTGWDRSSVTKVSLSSITDPGAGKVVTSTGAGAIAAYPPGYEFSYTERTTTYTSAATTTTGATTILSSGALSFDGSTKIRVEFYCPSVTLTTSGACSSWIVMDGSASATSLVARSIFTSAPPSDGDTHYGFVEFTPAAGSHTFTAIGVVSAGSGSWFAGASFPNTGNYVPMALKVSKA